MDRVRSSRIVRGVSLVLTGMLMGTLMLTPVGAHVSNSVDHLWIKHIKPEVRAQHYTKNQTQKEFFTRKAAIKRFLPTSGDLPKGVVLRGMWTIGGTADEAGQAFSDHISFGGSSFHTAPITHVIPSGEAPPAGCDGGPSYPIAEPHHLCIFVDLADNADLFACDLTLCGDHSTRWGTHLKAVSIDPGSVELIGTWAAAT